MVNYSNAVGTHFIGNKKLVISESVLDSSCLTNNYGVELCWYNWDYESVIEPEGIVHIDTVKYNSITSFGHTLLDDYYFISVYEGINDQDVFVFSRQEHRFSGITPSAILRVERHRVPNRIIAFLLLRQILKQLEAHFNNSIYDVRVWRTIGYLELYEFSLFGLYLDNVNDLIRGIEK